MGAIQQFLAIEGADRDLDSQLDPIECADESRGSKRFLASLSKHCGEAARQSLVRQK
jgi:hypothetical protein